MNLKHSDNLLFNGFIVNSSEGFLIFQAHVKCNLKECVVSLSSKVNEIKCAFIFRICLFFPELLPGNLI